MKNLFQSLFFQYRHFIFSLCLFAPILSFAQTENKITPSNSLSAPSGSLAASNGAGAAMTGDYSSADLNPAIMSALKKQYLIFTDLSYQNKINVYSLGVLDSSTTPVATLFRIRQNAPTDNETKDRRFTLGLSYQIPKTNLSFGISLDYQQLSLTSWSHSDDYNFFGGSGLLYEFVTEGGHPIFFAAGINRFFDQFNPLTYDLGVSSSFLKGYYMLGIDTLFSNLSGLTKIVGTLNVTANDFLDLKLSYGYLTRESKSVWASGIFFRAPILQLFYTLASSETNDTTKLRQTAGCAMNFVF